MGALTGFAGCRYWPFFMAGLRDQLFFFDEIAGYDPSVGDAGESINHNGVTNGVVILYNNNENRKTKRNTE